MYAYLTKENFKKISRMAVMVTTTISLLLISTIPSFGADSRPPQCLEGEQERKSMSLLQRGWADALEVSGGSAFGGDGEEEGHLKLRRFRSSLQTKNLYKTFY